jgi:hypothetical protein
MASPGGGAMTKVVVINGSARTEMGYTALILESFLDGMIDAGAEVELFYASQLRVKPCIGDFQCWYEKPGECVHKDNMLLLYSKLREAQIWVLGIPVYLPMPGDMQNIINRLCPLAEPVLEMREGRTRARTRPDVRLEKIVLVSCGGWWEMGNFQTVVRIAEELAEGLSVEFAGAVLRPHARLMKEKEVEAHRVLAATRRAGRELLVEGSMSEEALEAIREPLISAEDYLRRENDAYNKTQAGPKD